MSRVIIQYNQRRREGRGIEFDFPPASRGESQSQEGGKEESYSSTVLVVPEPDLYSARESKACLFRPYHIRRSVAFLKGGGKTTANCTKLKMPRILPGQELPPKVDGHPTLYHCGFLLLQRRSPVHPGTLAALRTLCSS